LDRNLYVCDDVCILYPTNYGQLFWAKGKLYSTAFSAINCSLWVYYGLFKKERDIPLAAANAPGILFGLVAALTALL